MKRLSSFPPRLLWCTALVCCWACFGSSAARADEKKEVKKITYEEHVAPIFRQKCAACHNADKKIGGLDLTNFTNMMSGGSSGEVISPGSAADSYLFMLVNHDEEPHMPPNSEKLPAEMLAVIQGWLDGGALENAGSKAMVPKKPKFDLSAGAPTGERPEGPPPMPLRQGLQPLVHTQSTTAVTALATSPWAPLAAVAGQKQVLLYNTKTLELIGVLPFPEGIPHVLKFSRNGSLLLAGGGHGALAGRVVVFDVKTGQRVFEVGDELDAVLAADISADHSMIALGGPSKVVRVYSTADSSLMYELRKHTEWIYSIEFSPDGILLATADRNGGVLVWESFGGREYLTLAGHSAGVTGLSWRLDSNFLASASEDRNIKLWEMQDGKQVKSWAAHGGGVAGIEFTRDGHVVSCGRDRVTKLWDQTGKEVRKFPAFKDLALTVSYCDETNRVIAGDWTGDVQVWEGGDAKPAGSLSVNPPTLAQRLERATAALKELEAAHAGQKAAFEQANAAAQAAQAAATKTAEQVAAFQKQLDAANAAAAAAKKTIDEQTPVQAAAQKQIGVLEKVVPPLTESVAKAQAAAQGNAEDKELATAAANLQGLLGARTSALDAARKQAAQATAALQAAQAAAQTAATQIAETTKALPEAQKQAAAAAEAHKTAQAKAAEAKQAFDAAAAKLEAAKQDVARWHEELAFDQALTELSTASSKHAESTAVVDNAKAELSQAQAGVAETTNAQQQAQAQKDAAVAEVAQAQTAATKAAEERDAATKAATTLSGAIPMIQEALAKSEQALAGIGMDAEVTAVIAQLKTVIAAKTDQMKALQATAAQKGKEIEAAQAAQTAAEQKIAAAEQALKQAAEQLASRQQAVAKAQTTVAEAEKAAAVTAKALSDAQATVARFRSEPVGEQHAAAGK